MKISLLKNVIKRKDHFGISSMLVGNLTEFELDENLF